MLQPRELNGEALFEMPHDTALHLAKRDQRADRRPLVAGDTGARLRHVDQPATDIDAVRQDQSGDRVARNDAAVAAISGSPRIWRLASQVSWAASLSRLRGVADIVIAKPF